VTEGSGGEREKEREGDTKGGICTHMRIHIYKYVYNVYIVIDMYNEMYV